jgi:hypothetical protein
MVSVDRANRRLAATAAALPAQSMAGYRAIEARAALALPDWTVTVGPPADTALPEIGFQDGVVDDAALTAAAWGSARTGRAIVVSGGRPAQRDAVAAGIVARGGRAQRADGDGPITLRWVEEGAIPAR